jgi:hypothetical protein
MSESHRLGGSRAPMCARARVCVRVFVSVRAPACVCEYQQCVERAVRLLPFFLLKHGRVGCLHHAVLHERLDACKYGA